MADRTTSAVLLVLFAGCAVSVDRYPPAITSILVNDKSPSSLVVSSVRNITIRCQSEGGTPIWWRVPAASQRYVNPSGILMIPKKDMDTFGPETYSGWYYCFTNNTLGTAVASPIYMEIGVVRLADATLEYKQVTVGSTVILTCRNEQSTDVRPSSLALEIPWVWYWQHKDVWRSFGRTDFFEMYYRTNGRVAIDERSRLYIRNFQQSDFNATIVKFIGCRSLQSNYLPFEVDAGKYSLNVAGTTSPPLTPTLIYSTKNVTVIEGGTFTLACIFNDVNGEVNGTVHWNNSVDIRFEDGARVTVFNASQQHSGVWECRYKGIQGKIKVFVRLYPRLSGLKDTFATVGDTVSLTCNYQATSGIVWYKNDQAISPVLFSVPSNNAQVVTLRNVSKNDVGVYTCEASNDVATIRLNGRLIITANISDDVAFPKLVDLSLVPITESSITPVAMELKNISSFASEFQPADVSIVSIILGKLANFSTNSTNATELLSKVSPYVADTVSNVMEATSSVLQEARRRDINLTARIIGSFDTMLLNLANAIAQLNTTTEDQPLVQSRNLAYQVTSGTAIMGLLMCSWDNGTNEVIVLSYNSSTPGCLGTKTIQTSEVKLSAAVQDVPRAFVVYSNDALFGPGAAAGASVLSAQLTRSPGPRENEGKEKLVSLKQSIDKAAVGQKSQLTCGYWNFSTNNWQTDGCSREPTEDVEGTYTCTCDHLTNFAVLMMPRANYNGGNIHDEVLGYISLIFLAVSCVALSLVLLTFIAYRKQRPSDGQKLTSCLSASLLCLNLFFIFGIKAENNGVTGCSVLAVFIHYFLLTSFLFMAAEVILYYLRLVKVFDAHVSYFIWKVMAVCLGVPALVVTSVYFGDPSLYVRGDDYCWVQPTLQIYGVMLPIGLAIAFNFVMFVIIAKALKHPSQLRSSASERTLAIRQAKALAAIFVVLGITWTFGFLAAIEATSVLFQYLFVISNALQGLFVFILHIVKPPVTSCVRNMMPRKTVIWIPKESKYSNDNKNTGHCPSVQLTATSAVGLQSELVQLV